MKNVKQILFLFLLLSIASSLIGESEQWLLLDEKKYSIEYPSEWALDQSGQMGSSFILLTEVAYKEDLFRENINLLIQDLSELNINLDKFVEISEEQVHTLITNGKLELSERTKNEAQEFHKFIYTGDQGMYKLKFQQYFWVINEEAFILTFTSQTSEFENYIEVAENIMKSFKIK